MAEIGGSGLKFAFSYYSYIVLFFDPRHPSGHSTSRLRGHSEGRRDGLPKGLDVGEVSIVTGSRRRTIHPLTYH